MQIKTALFWLIACAVPIALRAQDRPASPAPPRTSDLRPSRPLLSLESLSFLEGEWAAESRDGKTQLGTYQWVRELDGHLLARHGGAAGCDAKAGPVCGHNDLLYVCQDSPGAPLTAIFFDNKGHVIHYDISTRHEGSAADKGTRDYAVFLSDAAALGPRFRLVYERNTDTETGRTALSGRFETELPNGQWRVYQEWFGKKLR